jgi:hypothetical protein
VTTLINLRDNKNGLPFNRNDGVLIEFSLSNAKQGKNSNNATLVDKASSLAKAQQLTGGAGM